MISKNIRKDSKQRNMVQLSINELKQLIHWADYGVAKALGGTYKNEIIQTIEECRELCRDKRYGDPLKFGMFILK